MTASSPRPFLRPQSVALVALGGTFGAAAREGLVLSVPDAGHLPWAIVIANLAGAFLLGLLYEALNRSIPGRARGPRLRLLLGTGFCGGFTTYSTLAVGSVALAGWGGGPAAHGLGWAAGYAFGTVLAGALATWCGILAGSRRTDTRAAASPGSNSTGANAGDVR